MEVSYHKPVLLDEVLQALNVQRGLRYIDCTLGDGGHALEIVKRGGLVLGIDVNEGSLKRAAAQFENFGINSGYTFVKGNFTEIEKLATDNGFSKVSGIVFDLGYSSSQLEDGDLGLSFSSDQALDMRLDDTLGVQASDLLNALSEGELTRLFREYGEESYAKKFAEAIVRSRSLKKLQTTKQLVDVLVGAVSSGYVAKQRLHIATKVFQALRIAVNSELQNLEITLPRAASLLLPGGRMAIISFHSLEDRIVKRFGSLDLQSLKVIGDGPITPSDSEIRSNPRSRSSKMRVFEKI